MTKYPARVAITRGAHACNPDGTALYWVVSHRSIRYWVGPAYGPAAHVHEAQARRLASTLSQSDTPRRRKVR